MKIIDLIVIADIACSTSKTYLHYLNRKNFLVKKVILVNFRKLTPLEMYLKKGLPLFLSQRLISKTSTDISSYYSSTFKAACRFFQNYVPHPIDYFSEFDWQKYTAEVLNFTAEDFNDPFLQKVLDNEKCQNFLYTNGGIVPPSVLEKRKRRIFHIHPGIVPYVKGSDGLLWSALTRDKVGASCFYMDAGIDTGTIIQTKEWVIPHFSNEPIEGLDLDTLYRALLYSFDPHLRAELFSEVVENFYSSLNEIPSKVQKPQEGRTYYAMHPQIKLYALEKMGLSSKISSLKN